MKHNLSPLEPPFSDDISGILERYPRTKDGYILKLFRLFANSKRFLTDKGVANLLDPDSPLTVREREIIILRVTANKNCEYEWGVHVTVFSDLAGLSKDQINATRLEKPDAECWSERETLLIQCVDEICEHAKIQDGRYERFQENWTGEQQLEILSLCGTYQTISIVANTVRLDKEGFSASFPKPV